MPHSPGTLNSLLLVLQAKGYLCWDWQQRWGGTGSDWGHPKTKDNNFSSLYALDTIPAFFLSFFLSLVAAQPNAVLKWLQYDKDFWLQVLTKLEEQMSSLERQRPYFHANVTGNTIISQGNKTPETLQPICP